MLLQAYDEEDRDNAKRALNDPFIKHMDVEYAILARDLRLPQGNVVVQKKPIVENATDEYKRVRPQNDEVSLSKNYIFFGISGNVNFKRILGATVFLVLFR